MEDNSDNKEINFGFTTIAFILSAIFMVLKLCNVIAWSWWLVFLPLIIVVGLQVVTWIVIFIIALIMYFIDR